MPNTKNTLCWKCQNAVPSNTNGCDWSRHGAPVEGWTAKPTKILQPPKATIDSYLVIDCPNFKPDKRRKRSKD